MFYISFLQLRNMLIRYIGKPLKAVTTATLLAFFLSTALLSVNNHTTHAQAFANTLSIQATYVTDSAQNPKNSFKSGDSINYHIDATNSSGQTMSVSVVFWADTTIQFSGKQYQFIIIEKTFTVNMPPGLSRFYTPSVIPAGVTSGTYIQEGVIYQNSDRTNSSIVLSKGFNVTHITNYPLQVPYFSQFDDSLKNNECGETAVAMVAAYFVDLYDSPKEWITAVRDQIGVKSSDETNADQLASALWGLPGTGGVKGNGLQINVTPLSSSIAQAIQQIQTATKAGYPVIAFVNGTKLKPSRSYTGHWIVITGISGQTVYVNDPDSSSGGTGKHQPIQLSLSVYKTAAETDALNNVQTYGLIVNGEDFQSP